MPARLRGYLEEGGWQDRMTPSIFFFCKILEVASMLGMNLVASLSSLTPYLSWICAGPVHAATVPL